MTKLPPEPLQPFIPASFLSVGSDIVEVERVSKAIERYGDHFLKKVFTEAELALCLPSANAHQRLAARFAAKEAASKAIGTGISAHFGWQSLSVESGSQGEPVAVLDTQGRRAVAERGGTDIRITLSHTKSAAFATAVLIK